MARGVKAAAAAGPVEGPWALPEGWQWERLGDVTSEPSRGSPSSKFKDTFRYLDVGGLGEGRVGDLVAVKDAPSRARQFLEAGDIALSTVRPYLRRTVHLQSQDADVASTAFCVLRAKPDLDSRFLFHWVTSDQFVSRLLPLQRGSSPPAVLDVDVRAQPLPVPPADLQRLLVSRIDTLFAEVAAGEEALAAAKTSLGQWRQALLKAAVTGDLTADWRATNPPAETGEALLARILADRRTRWTQDPRNKGKRYPEPPPPDTTDLPTLPEDWAWATLPQLGEFGRGKSKHRPRNDPRLYGGPYPFVQTGIVANSDGEITAFDQTYSELGLNQSKLWPEGTLCITIAANIAKTGVLNFAGCFPDSIVGVAPAEGVNPRYLDLVIRTLQSGIEADAPATAQKNINLETLETIPIPLPPSAEQAEIVKVMGMAKKEGDAVISLAEGQPGSGLRQSILAAAFRGELAA